LDGFLDGVLDEELDGLGVQHEHQDDFHEHQDDVHDCQNGLDRDGDQVDELDGFLDVLLD
jgi:hypothetical protein